jgi:LytS/YehU family sensor histidine kinase
LELLFIGFVVSLIVRIRQRNLRNKLWAEQSELKAKLLMLEQQSMNSSMNRHFIFNALNSIQYYINRQDRKLANQYLTDFAKLIRKNLDSGQENYTPLSEELDRLELYLKLEQMRFPGAFEYKIITTGILNLNTLRIPAMLLQPFLENSIWHGLIPKGSEGFLKLEVTEISERLMITIEDNGIGIEASQLRKTSSDTHISKGMEITRNRLDLIQQMTQVAILLEGPTDITLPSGKQVTRVKLIFPKEIQEIFSERTDS